MKQIAQNYRSGELAVLKGSALTTVLQLDPGATP